ncbi:hypothetical protein GQ53DRAFT_745915 [Thozetella sp. PMI_491]|nr:hypothetical protein GQ53DRAFT_745915 [Thozetella sp. PMI_491]
MASSTEQSASGPRACVTCAKAKTRCLPGPVASICSRCYRLRKPCASQEPAPPRRRKERAKKQTRRQALEQRIEAITSRLGVADGGENRAAAGVEAVSPPAAADEPPVPPGDNDGVDESLTAWEPFLAFPPRLRLHAPLSRQRAREGLAEFYPATKLRDRSLGGIIDHYRAYMQPAFPFVVIPDAMSNEDARRAWPLCWRALELAATWPDDAESGKLGDKLIEDIMAAAVRRPCNTIDLFKSLLVVIAWYHWNLDSFQLANLLGLARSLACSKKLGNIKKDFDLVEARAYCGWYYLSAITFARDKELDSSPLSTYLDEACGTISSNPDAQPSDEVLLALIRIQRLLQSTIFRIREREGKGQSGIPDTAAFRESRRQIDELRESLTPNLKGESFVQTHLLVVEMALYEAAVISSSSRSLATTEKPTTFSSGRWRWAQDIFPAEKEGSREEVAVENVKDSMASVVAFLSARLVPSGAYPDLYRRLTLLNSFGIDLCLGLCHRLVASRQPIGLEAEIKRMEVNVLGLLEKETGVLKMLIAEKLAARETMKPRGHDDTYLPPGESQIAHPTSTEATRQCPFKSMVCSLEKILSLLRDDIGERQDQGERGVSNTQTQDTDRHSGPGAGNDGSAILNVGAQDRGYPAGIAEEARAGTIAGVDPFTSGGAVWTLGLAGQGTSYPALADRMTNPEPSPAVLHQLSLWAIPR